MGTPKFSRVLHGFEGFVAYSRSPTASRASLHDP